MKKFLAVLLAVITVACVFVACSKADNKDTTNESSTTSAVIATDKAKIKDSDAIDFIKNAYTKKELGLDIAGTYEFESLKQVSDLTSAILENTKALEKALVAAKDISDFEQEAFFYRDEIFPAMTALRAVVDELEGIVDAKVWPYPSYGKLLFGII